ncbi:MAG: HTH domain-containing protein [Kurthia sp.]|nr:HTH domain-containing protein [Candidatus Kurthia equi]
MPIKIAFISSEAYKKYIASILKNIDDIEIDFYIYQQHEEAVQLVKKIKGYDVIIVGGLIPYLHIQSSIKEFPCPCLHIEQDETSVATTLLSVLANKPYELSEIAIDVIDENFVHNVLNDLNYKGSTPYILQSTSETLYEQYMTLFNTKKIKLIITSVHPLYNQLIKENIPVLTMMDSKTATIQKLESIKAEVLLQKSNANRAAAGLVYCADKDFGLFLQLVKIIHARYKKTANNCYEIYTTTGSLQYMLQHKDLHELLNLFKQPYTIGFGYGENFTEAMKHAQEAIKFAKPNEIYLLNSLSELSGPYPNKHTMLSLQLQNSKIIEMSEKTKLSALSLAKIMAFIKERQSHQFTAQDLADYLHVTRRTAERSIKKLLEHNYIEVISSEMTYQKGRPRSVYTLKKFPE